VVVWLLVLALGLPALIGAVMAVKDYLDNEPAPSSRQVPARIAPFGRVGFRVGDDPATYCALLASTPQAQAQGMQNRSDLGGYDAMIFAFEQDSTTQFVNHFVPIDLDIGWYDASGGLVDFTTMDKCPEGDNCPTYAARGPYRYAVETAAGGLAALGLTGSGATLSVGGGCG
jgi:uncharacterized membrane protein (UPF0127 family)